MAFQIATLDNGLTILSEANPHAHSFAAGIYVRAGARDETPSNNGVSHFLEHMMFKGSDKLGWESINRGFDDLGARYNAYTTQELTAYYASVLPEFSERILRHLKELLSPALRDEDFDTEKNVILEEIAMYNDEPGQRVYEHLMAEHFAGHPLERSVLGTSESITHLKREQMHAYFVERYTPANMVLSVSGRFDFDHVVALARELFASRAGIAPPRDYRVHRAEPRKRDLTDPKVTRAYVMGMTPGPDAQDPDRFAARVLADCVGDADGSRLYWALVDRAIAEDADFGFYPHDRSGSFYLSLTTDPQRREQALDIALAELRKVRDQLTEDEVTRARNKLRSSLTLGGESPLGRMRSVATQWLYTRSYRSLEDDMASLASISVQSCRDLLDRFPLDPFTIVSLSPS